MTPKISKKSVRRAGRVLANAASADQQLNDAAERVNLWRKMHVPVLQALFDVLEDAVGMSGDVLVAGRIKKFDTIVDKLRRPNAVKNLDTMYDIVGCRVVFPSLDMLNLSCKRLFDLGCWDQEKTSKHNYLDCPKESGYRGRHLVFVFNDEESGCKLNAELQLRTSFQHAWATAVEMYDMAVEGSRLKYNEIDNQSGVFFKRASDLIHCFEVGGDRGTYNVEALIRELREADRKGGILSVLESAGQSVSILGNPPKVCVRDYCLIDFNVPEQSIVLKKLPLESAVQEYFQEECKANRDATGHNMVLVRGADIGKLERAYPNYFGDISVFSNFIRSQIC